MKSLRHIALSLAMACGAALGLASLVLQPLLHFVSVGCDALACGIQKLDRELAQKFGEVAKLPTSVSAGMQRESNGYRQTSATDEDWLATPAT